jgi:hypothetical protein
MPLNLLLRPAAITCALLGVASCAKKSQNAVVVAKEHIPAHVEGTPYQEREMDREQWLVKIQFEGGRTTSAPVDAEQWKTLNVGDRVVAQYSEGKHTGTIWAIEVRKQ